MRVLILGFFLLLTACGFHLRGVYQLPPQLQQVYINYAQTYDPFIVKLRQALIIAKVIVVDQPERAKYILQINKIEEAPVLQAASTTGQVNTYAMQYKINFTLTDETGAVIIPAQTVQSSATYTLSSTQLLTSFNQPPNVTTELQQSALNQVLARLSSKNAQKALGNETLN